MKKVLKVMCSLIFILAIFFTISCNRVGCGSSVKPEKILSWNIPSLGENNELVEGTYLDLNNSTIEVQYQNGDVREKNVDYSMVNIYDFLNLHVSVGSKKVKVSYEESGITVSFDVVINVVFSNVKQHAINDVNALGSSTETPFTEDAQARLDALKSIAINAIYSSRDENIEEIVKNVVAAYKTMKTAQQEEADNQAVNTALKSMKDELNAKVENLVKEEGSVSKIIEDKLAGYVKISNLTMYDYSDEIEELRTKINNISITGLAEIKYETDDTNNTATFMYRLHGSDEFVNLYTVSTLAPVGTGKDGREVSLQVSNGFIQWKYSDETSWTNLIEVATLTGKDGNSVTEFKIENDEIIVYYSDSTHQAIEGFQTTVKQLVEEEIATVISDVNQMKLDLYGPNGNDGLISKVEELKVQVDTLENGTITEEQVKEYINELKNTIVNFGLPIDETGANLFNTLELLFAEKIIVPINEYLGSSFTLDEIIAKVKELIPYVQKVYEGRSVVLEKLNEVRNIMSSDLTLKEKLTSLLEVVKGYDEVLLALGVTPERVELISTTISSLKEYLLRTIKDRLTSLVNQYVIESLYDFDTLLVEYSNVSELASYKDEIYAYLNSINYDGAAKFSNIKNQILHTIDTISVTNMIDSLLGIVGYVFELQTIDSLNEVVPAMLATYLEAEYNKYYVSLVGILNSDDLAKTTFTKDTYLMAILKSKSVLESVEYFRIAVVAIKDSTPFKELEKIVLEMTTTEDVLYASEKLNSINDSIKNNIKNTMGAQLENAAWATARVEIREELKTKYPNADDEQINQLVASAKESQEVIDRIEAAINEAIDNQISDLYQTLVSSGITSCNLQLEINQKLNG